MSFATRSRFVVSTSARLSALYALLLLAAFALMGAAIVQTTKQMTTHELQGPLRMEAAFVREVIATEGLAHAIGEINLRTAHSTLLLHRLDDAQGRLLAGDGRLPQRAPGWSYTTLPRADGRGGEVVLLTSDVGSGARFTVGVELTWPNAVRDAALRTLALVGVVVLTLALTIGLVSTNFTFRRMRALWQALRQAGQGDFQVRAAVRSPDAPDDIDALALRFNDLMDHTDRLVANVRRVSASVAHDLRTPLTHLSQSLDRARGAETLDAAHQEIATAQEKVTDILRLFESMLHLAEIETGRLRASFETVDASQIVEQVLDAYRPQIEERGGALVTDIAPQVHVHGAAALITRALSNLLDNAEAHAGGDTVRVTLASADGDVVLAVEDEGPGIAPPDMERMLRPFERLDQSRGTPGAGLGLSIVSAIAELHEAELRLENQTTGLRASIRFPGAVGAAA